MPQRLKQRQTKIQNKRKKTPWREFVMEICSWYPLMLNKSNGVITKYPKSDRSPTLNSTLQYGNLEFNQETGDGLFSDFKSLWSQVSFPPLTQQGSNENTGFVEMAFGLKNGYLSFTAGVESENVLYSSMVYGNCKNIVNCVEVLDGCENVFNSRSIFKSSLVFNSICVLNSHHIYGCSDMVGCSYCIKCFGLQGKLYCIENTQYSKEEYERRSKDMSVDNVIHKC